MPRDLIMPDPRGRCNWCDHPKTQHVYTDNDAPQCHACRGGYCKPKPGRTWRVNRQLKKRWRNRG